MAAHTSNDGDQTLTFDYKQNATSTSFNSILRGIMKPGIYEGGLLARINDTTVSLSSYVAVINASNDDTIAIRVEAANSFNVTVSSTNTVVVLRFEWHEQEDNYVRPLAVPPGSVVVDDIVVGTLNFSGSTLTSISYDNATNPREAVSQDADTILLGSSVSINSNPAIGTSTGATTASVFVGTSTYITTVLTDIYNRLIDLSGVRDNSVKERHIEIGVTSTGIHGNKIPTGLQLDYLGSSPDSILSSVNISSALQTIIDLISDLSGASDDSVKKRLIDFGTGASQVNLADFPLGSSGTQAIAGDFTDFSWAVSDSLNSILASLSSIVDEIATQVNTNTSNISSLDGRISTLEGKTFMDDIPVGMIMMFSGTSWSSSAMDGKWRVCDGTNGTPNLVDKFVKGASSLSGNPVDNYGGNATVTLDITKIPEHSHTIAGTISGTTGVEGEHTHQQSVSQSENEVADHTALQANLMTFNKGLTTVSTGAANPISHSHSFSGVFSGNSGNAGQTSPGSIAINPSHYKLIYIMKIS